MFPFWIKHSRHVRKLLAGTLASLLTIFFFPSFASADFDPTATRSSEAKSPALLKFQYRLFPAEEVDKVEVTQNGKALEFRHTPFANNPLNTRVIAVLVDTSVGSARAPRDRTLADNKQFIQALLAKAQENDLIGVYAFANDLVEVASVGSPFTDISNKIAPLKANGLGTRIYRQGMNAVEKIATFHTARKALVILSDGKDEDNGFTKDDLIKTALKQGVMVFAMGCPETGADIPALGNLEKIAAETRGLYARGLIGNTDSGDRLRADTAFAQAVLDSVASGSEVLVPLDSVDPSAEILIQVTTKAGETFRYVHQRPPGSQPTPQPVTAPTPVPQPVTTPSPTSAVSPVEVQAAVISPAPTSAPLAQTPLSTPSLPVPATSPTAEKPSADTDGTSKLFNAPNLISLGAIVLLIAAALTLRRLKKTKIVEPAPAMRAYLQMQDAESKRLPLTKPANRIGRRADNDIVFTNTSISGYHAEIHAQRDGSYRITDLGSGNGVNINNQRVTQSDLKDGDLIELGEVRFRFYHG